MNIIDKCRICGSGNVSFDKELPAFLLFKNELRYFFVCHDCGTIMDSSENAPDIDEDEDMPFDVPPYIKHYIEVGSGLLFLASQLQFIAVIKQKFENSKINYLDIGTGFGFTVHMAQKLGWDAIGIEPSNMGKIGSKLLELDIVFDYLEKSTLPEHQFNIISASEAIEHVQNPDIFVNTISRYLAPKGIMILTTPNAEVVIGGDKVEKEWFEAYAPGSHFNLLSPQAINIILTRNGFNYVKILLSEGSSGKKRITVLAAKEDIIPDNLNYSSVQPKAKLFLKEYLKDIIFSREQRNINDALYSGALYRLFELLVNEGLFEDAKAYADRIDTLLECFDLNESNIDQLKVDSFEEYVTKAPAYLGHYYFYKGMMYLNHDQNYQKAVRYFQICSYLSKIEEDVALGFYPGNWYALAKLHEGLGMLYDHKQREAIKIFDELLKQPQKLSVDALETLYSNKGVAHLQVRENNQALRYFIDVLLKKNPEYSPPAQHLMLALNQYAEDLQNQIDFKVNSLAETYSQEIDSKLKNLAETYSQEIDSKLNNLAETYSRDKAMFLEKIDKYEALLNLGIDKFNRVIDRVNGITKIIYSLLAAPTLVSQKLFKPSGNTISQDRSEITIGEIISDRLIEQQIICTENNFSSIFLKIGTFDRLNTTQIHIDILDEAKNQIRSIDKSTSLFNDNKLNGFSFESIPNSKGKKYWISISSNTISGNAVTLWCNRQKVSPIQLIIDGKKSSNSLIYELGYTNTGGKISLVIKDILIITPDKLGKIRIGLGMRHWEIAKALASRDLKVTLATPYPIPSDLQGEGFELCSALSQQQVLEIAQKYKFVMVQGDILLRYPNLEASDKRIIVDMVTPFHIEDIEKGQKEFEHGYSVIQKCLLRGNYFICGNEWQRVYWLGMLTSLGRINRQIRNENAAFYSLIDVAGFGISDEPPVKSHKVLKGVFSNIKQDDFVIMWMGGIWDWLDPLTLIEGVHKAHQEDDRIKLFFPAYRQSNGNPSLMAEKSRNLCVEIDALDKSVFFNEYPVPYQERGNYLLESDVGVVCQAANFETQISARTRVLDYIWAGLPILINEGDEWCELVRKHDLGLVVSGNSVDEWKDAILKLASDSEARNIKTANIEKIKPQYYWKRLVEPIIKYITLKTPE